METMESAGITGLHESQIARLDKEVRELWDRVWDMKFKTLFLTFALSGAWFVIVLLILALARVSARLG